MLKILLAIDWPELSEAVVREVEQRPWRAGTVVCVLTAIMAEAVAERLRCAIVSGVK